MDHKTLLVENIAVYIACETWMYNWCFKYTG